MPKSVTPEVESELDLDYIKTLTPDQRCDVALELSFQLRVTPNTRGAGCDAVLLMVLTRAILDVSNSTASMLALKTASKVKIQNLCGVVTMAAISAKSDNPKAVHLISKLVKAKLKDTKL